jgi:type I restriction enzyme S subunit
VRGNLVPQNANDEPASELLKRIATERQCIASEKGIRKKKPVKLMKNKLLTDLTQD